MPFESVNGKLGLVTQTEQEAQPDDSAFYQKTEMLHRYCRLRVFGMPSCKITCSAPNRFVKQANGLQTPMMRT
jgi:hypothetical protein